MIYLKLAGVAQGQSAIWLETPATSLEAIEGFKAGLVAGFQLSTGRQLQVLDTRLSKHPTETTYSIAQAVELFSGLESPNQGAYQP